MRMTEKCHNNNSDNPLNSRRTYGGKNVDGQWFNVSCLFYFSFGREFVLGQKGIERNKKV